MGSVFFRGKSKGSYFSKQALAEKAVEGSKWWFQNGKITGVIAGLAAGALSHSFDQSMYVNGAFALSTYLVHATYASIMNHARKKRSA